MSKHSALSDLSEQFAEIITSRDEQRFYNLIRRLCDSPSSDEIMGGLFSDTSAKQKHIDDVVHLAAMCTIAANVFSVPDYAKIAISGLNYLCQYHRLGNGFYADTSSYTNTEVDSTDLSSMLDPAQWLALKTYFELPDKGIFQWHQQTRHVPIEGLAEATGLHPKQAPWAFEGGLQLLQSKIKEPVTSTSYSIRSNMLFCYGLLLSATYLNQTQHAEVALQLMPKISQHGPQEYLDIWQLLLLQRLAYHWDEHDFNNLSNLFADADDIPVAGPLLKLCQINRPEQHSQLTKTAASTSSSLYITLLNHCEYVVMIEGPAYQARQWLQLTNNHYNPAIWIFARPSQQSCTAQILNSNGQLKSTDSIDGLLKLVSEVTRSIP